MAIMTMPAARLTKRVSASVAPRLAKAGRRLTDILDAFAEARMLGARIEIDRYRRVYPDRNMPVQARR